MHTNILNQNIFADPMAVPVHGHLPFHGIETKIQERKKYKRRNGQVEWFEWVMHPSSVSLVNLRVIKTFYNDLAFGIKF